MEHHLCARHSAKYLHTGCLIQVSECWSYCDPSHFVAKDFTFCGACSRTTSSLISTQHSGGCRWRFAVKEPEPQGPVFFSSNWQNQDLNLDLLTLYCCNCIGRERWCVFIKFLLLRLEKRVYCALFRSSIRRVLLSHFTDEKAEAQRGEAIGRKPLR